MEVAAGSLRVYKLLRSPSLALSFLPSSTPHGCLALVSCFCTHTSFQAFYTISCYCAYHPPPPPPRLPPAFPLFSSLRFLPAHRVVVDAMSRLHIPGIPLIEDRASRFKSTGAVFRPLPRRVAFRENPERAPRRSLLPVPSKRPEPPRPETRLGPRLSSRSGVSPPSARSARPAPATATASARSSLVSRLEERRAARLARPRPWLEECKSSLTLDSAAKGPKSTVRPPSPSAPSRPTVLPPTAPARVRRAVALIDAVLAKPAISKGVAGRNKDKSVKRVRFGEMTVVTVPRWIERKDHVFPDPGRIAGRLQGWKVTQLEEPDEDGEMCKYTTYWGHSQPSMLAFNHYRPCGRGCAWNRLAALQRKLRAWDTEAVFKAWLAEREKIRQRGGFAL